MNLKMLASTLLAATLLASGFAAQAAKPSPDIALYAMDCGRLAMA
jgi:hypothetical protein